MSGEVSGKTETPTQYSRAWTKVTVGGVTYIAECYADSPDVAMKKARQEVKALIAKKTKGKKLP